ncbi:MAG: peptidase M48 Ste24p [Rhodospirillales bacterium]|nr:MAG: peptidase M48 Ste24p [Rhodospirillales bacterium]
MAGPLDRRQQRRHKLRNAVQTGLLLAGMTVLLTVCAWLIAGWEGVLWAAIGGAVILAVTPKVTPGMVLAMYRARPLSPTLIPELYQSLAWIAERAGLPAVPRLYYVPSSMLNAFAVGNPAGAVVAVTDGLLRTLNLRELTAVLAHEISHIRNHDLWVMGLADIISRLTRVMAFAGILLLAISLPVWLAEQGRVPVLLILVLLAAPSFGSLLQLALSRAREFDADLDAAGMTGDPAGLASALQKMERVQGRFWEFLIPDQRIPDPSLLRTHPPTEERVARLMSLYAAQPGEPGMAAGRIAMPMSMPEIDRRPRRHANGLWY